MTYPKIYKKVKSILFSNPKLLYEEERHLISQPFYFEGNNNKAVLLIHGWSSVPYEIRRLGKYLNKNGYTVIAPMLSGHGTVPKDLEDIKWEDWIEDAERAYQKIKNKYKKIYIGGTSIGANISAIMLARHLEISGGLLLAMPYKIRWEEISLFFAKLLSKIKKYNKKVYPPTFGASTTITRIISYQSYPIKSVLEAFYLVQESRKHISKIIQPCYLIQSTSDHIVPKGNLETIFSKISSDIKKKRYIRRAYHTFISDIENEHVFEDIVRFFNEN